jgi:protein-tyrosine phosphatase
MFECKPHWIPGIAPHRLALTPRPEGGAALAAEVQRWQRAGIGLVVSLLVDEEIEAFELQAEPVLCAAAGIDFMSFPIPDHGTPASHQALLPLLESVHEALSQGTAVAIHCHAGIGRTGVVSGCLLHRLGVRCEDIFHVLSRARGYSMPETAAQLAWAEAFMRHRP